MLHKLHFRRMWYAIGAGLLVVIIVGSLIPVPKIALAPYDKLVHFLTYFVLMAWFGQLHRSRSWLAIGFILLGLLLETLQGRTHYREFEWYDVAANSVGVACAWLAVMTPFGRILPEIDRWLLSRAYLRH